MRRVPDASLSQPAAAAFLGPLALGLALATASSALAQPGWVLAHQKISDTQGGFGGVLDNNDRFGTLVSAPGELDRFNESKADSIFSYSGNRMAFSQATSYTFTAIADTSGAFANFNAPSLNDAGTVTFRALFDDGGEGIFTGEGGVIITVADTSTGVFDSFHNGRPDINNAGTVAFGATLTSGVFGMFSVWNGEITTIANSVGPLHSFLLFHTINNQGAVAFGAKFDGNFPFPTGVFTGSGGPLTTIADTFGPFAGLAGWSINDQGTVAFRVTPDEDFSLRMVLTGNGGPFTTIADESGPFIDFSLHLGMNGQGTVVIVATLEDGSKSIITGDGGPLTTVVDASGPFATFGLATINDDGTVAFVGILDSGEQGIFVGPDPVEDQVIRIGDPLFGSTVTGFTFAVGGRGLNNNGQLAFKAFLEDDRRVIVRATPVSELSGLDVKPGSCPNSFNPNSHGVLPVALVGTADFDVTQIDIASVQLSRADGVGGSVAPHEGPPGPHSEFEDVATTFQGKEPCDCHDFEGDGINDLSMKFITDEMVEALQLNDLPPGDLAELIVSGTLLDGTPFSAGDCIRLVPPGDLDANGSVGILDLLALLSAWGSDPGGPPDFDGDGTVGILDLLTLLANWGQCP